nr:helicase [Tanacetum cinerariifolium]
MNNFVRHQGDDNLPLPQALENIVGTSLTLEFKSHTYYKHNMYKSYTCWRIVIAEGMGDSGGSSMVGGSHAFETRKFKRLLRHPLVTTPSKVDEGKKHKRVEAEESDVEALFVADTQTASGMGGSLPNIRKFKRLNKKLRRDKSTCIRMVMLQPDGYRECRYTVTSKNEEHVSIGVNTSLESKGVGMVSYHNIGAPSNQYVHCNATMWYEERINKGNRAVNPSFSLCCQEAKLWLPKFNLTPQPLHNLLNYSDPATSRFRDQIRGVYTFRVNTQSYHKIRSLYPKEGTQHRYAQLWFFDTGNEVRNHMGAFINKDNSDAVDATTIQSYIQMLGQYSCVAKAFQMAKDWCHSHASVNVEFHLPSKRTNASNRGNRKTNYGFMTMKEYYYYIIQQKNDQGNTLVRGGRLFQQYLVDAYLAVKEQRLKWTRNNQDTLRIDDIILTELPSVINDPDDYKAVAEYILHGPCGKNRRYASCITEGITKHEWKIFNILSRSSMPQPTIANNMENRLIREALNFDMNKSRIEHERLHPLLNPEQRLIYKKVIHYVHNQRGIVALLLLGRRIAYSRFIIPLELLENSTCGIKQNTYLAELVQEVQLIIWDKAPMTQKYTFEALDNTLRDILGLETGKKRENLQRHDSVVERRL